MSQIQLTSSTKSFKKYQFRQPKNFLALFCYYCDDTMIHFEI